MGARGIRAGVRALLAICSSGAAAQNGCGLWDGGVAASAAVEDGSAPNDATPFDANTTEPDAGGEDVVDAGAPDVQRCPIDENATVPAIVRISVDNYRKLYVNGALIDGTTYQWYEPTAYVVPVFRHPSRANVIAVEATNELAYPARDRGALVDVRFGPLPDDAGPLLDGGWIGSDAGATPDSGTFHLLSNASWLVRQSPSDGWMNFDAGDASFAPAIEQAVNGDIPWGSMAGFAPASTWIWLYDSNVDSGAKPAAETIYFRRVFYIDESGAPVDAPKPCP